MSIFQRGWFYAALGIVLFACLFAVLNEAFRGMTATSVSRDASLDQTRIAFARVAVGKTEVPDLAGLGFDATRPGVQTLSYLGVMERFMPRTATGFDNLDPAMQVCLNAQGRCTGYVFPLAHAQIATSFFGTAAQAAAPITGPRITFLIRSGRVAYKALDTH